MNMLPRALCALALGSGCAASGAAEVPPLTAAISGGKVHADLRLRYETVDQDNTLERAEALTLRTVLGYTTASWHGLSAMVEFENVSALVDDYSPRPPPERYALIVDPEGAEVNQWLLRYDGIAKLSAVVGRSRLVLDNGRWIGNTGWRQNEQTFDGAFLKVTPTAATTLQFAWLNNVNSNQGLNIDLDAQLLHAQHKIGGLTLSAYGYWLDYATPTATTPDSQTYGLRATGATPLSDTLRLLYTAEFARQSAETPAGDFDAPYGLGELGLAWNALTLRLSYEWLGSDDGEYGVLTPLSVLHPFNGWADQFLAIPATGLRNASVSLAGRWSRLAWLMAWHDFDADDGGAHYGDEWNAQLTLPLAPGLDGGVKFAAYRADERGADTDKIWIWLQYKF